MGPRRGRLWWPVVVLLVAAVSSGTNLVNAQANAVNDLNKEQDGRAGFNLSPLGHQISNKLQDNPRELAEKDQTRINQKKEIPFPMNVGQLELNSVKQTHKRHRVISKREAKKPKNTKRRVKFNKKEFEQKLQQQEKEEKESGVKATSKDESRVDTSEVLSSSNSLVPESGKESGSSSTYESYSESSDSDDENDIDDDDDKDDDDDDSDEDDDDDDDEDDDASDDKTESTEEISLTSEEESKKSKDVSLSTIPHSGPDSSPPASSDSTDESSGSKAISSSSSEYSEISYTMSSSAEDAFPVGDSSADETKEKEVDGSTSKEKSKSKASKSVKLAKKKKIKAGAKARKSKRLKLDNKNGQNKQIKVNKNVLQVVGENDHSLIEKNTKNQEHSLRLEVTTGKVLHLKENTELKEKSEQLSDREVRFQATTERVLRMVQNAVQKNKVSPSLSAHNPSTGRKASTKDGLLASKERPAMELLKVKPADPNRKDDLEQELIKDYPENGTVEITNWAGTFAPIYGEPYVAPLHKQPDEFWDAIYTSKDPDLPTPPGAVLSREVTVQPLHAPEINMRRTATMINHPIDHEPNSVNLGPNHNFENQPNQGHLEDSNKIKAAKDKNKGSDKTEKKKPKLTLKEKRLKKKEKKEGLTSLLDTSRIVAMTGTNHGYSQNQPSNVALGNLEIHDSNKIEAKDKNKGKEKKGDKKKPKLTIKEKRKKKKEKKENLGGKSDVARIVAMTGNNPENPQSQPSALVHKNPVIHADGLVLTQQSDASPHSPDINKIEAKDKDKNKGSDKKTNKKKAKLTLKEKRKKKKEKKENLAGKSDTARIVAMTGMNHEYPQNQPSDVVDKDSIMHDDDLVHPHLSGDSPLFPGKIGPLVEDISIKVHAKGKSEESLKTPSEEERESGTTYKPEGAYEYPSFRHPEFNPDTAYDEHGIPIHESPGWTPPPTLPGDNRFGKGRNQAGAGMRKKANGPIPMPQVAKNRRPEPKRLAVTVTDPKYSLHPEDKMINNYHGIQDHMALLEHQRAVEGHQGLHLNPLHPTVSPSNLNLPLIHKEGFGIDPVNHRIRKRKAAVSGSSESMESISQILDSDELEVSSKFHDPATAKETAYKLTETELKNKEDSAPIEALNPALYSYKNMFQALKKTPRPEPAANLGDLCLDKLPINLKKLAKNSAEVVAVIISKDGSIPKCHIHSKMKNLELPPLPLSSPEKPEVYNKKNKNEGRNPLLYKHRNMLKISDLKDDGFRINEVDMIKQLVQDKLDKRQNRKGIRLDDYVKLTENHPLKGRGRENFNPLFINENKLFRVKTNKLKPDSKEHIIVRREVKEALNPALYSYKNLFSSDPQLALPKEKGSPQNGQDDFGSGGLPPNGNAPLFGGRIPIVDEESNEQKRQSSAKQYVGKIKEFLNPFLINFPNMFKVNFDSPAVKNNAAAKTEERSHTDLKTYVERHKEIQTPLRIQHQNIFSANYDKKIRKSNKKEEALNPHLLQLTNAFGARNNDLHSIPLEKGEISPAFISSQKGYTEKEKETVLSRHKNLFSSAAKTYRRNKTPNIKNDLYGSPENDRLSSIARVRRHIEETENNQLRDSKRHEMAKEHNHKTKNEHSIGLGTPGAGRPKSFKRKTKDSEDSFASYFDGVDHNIVEEDDSTPTPERTTGENGTDYTNENQKTLAKRKRIIQGHAKILHQLTKKLRPFWRNELERHNLSPDNTTVEFTSSMEEEIHQAIERKLLSGPPNDETIDELTKDLYTMIDKRKRENRSTGHIIPGTRSLRDPLIKGVFEVHHGIQLGKYHLQYWPQDDPEDTRVLNGTLSMKDLNIDLAHKHASNKILKKILTIKPHYLTYSKADEVLNMIFPRTLDSEKVENSGGEQKSGIVSVPLAKGETNPLLEETSVPAKKSEMKVVLKESNVPVQRGKTNKSMKEDSLSLPRSENKPVSKENPLLASRGETKPILKEKSLPETSPLVTKEPPIKTTMPIDEFAKLRETISESRNISSILLDEIESRLNNKMEESFGRPEEKIQQGSWKLQQRIKDFKPSRPYHPTLPPFVRKWPTFRSRSDASITDLPQVTNLPETTFATFLTMRPKYSGPRLKSPFFFSDFQSIGTVYPSTTVSAISETTVRKLGWLEAIDLLGVGVSREGLPNTISPERLEKVWASVEKMFTQKPPALPEIEEEEKKFFKKLTTEEPEQSVEKVETTLTPWFLRMTRRMTITTTPLPSTTKRSHLHVIKHHVKKGFTRLMNFFGFGDIESEEIEGESEK